MSAIKTKTYNISFIFDLRDSEDDTQKVIDDIQSIITDLGGEAIGHEILGMRQFARAADQRFTQGHYVQLQVNGGTNIPSDLKEKLLHDRRVNRIFVEA
ncbi:MAG: 30S ribosomal protein S6 [Opitutia bacterium UBA7350]|nr:MAG: 30S ribosomal protein S6 [Opitutae bacterium UBA7350]